MTIGNQLKKARQKKEVTIDEAYQRTRIHPKVLTALEEDRYDDILNQTYVRSFLKEYASYLGMNVSEVLNEYNSQHKKGASSIQIAPAQEIKAALSDFDIEKILKILKVILVWAVCIVILIFTIKGINLVTKKIKSAPPKKADLPAKKPSQPKAAKPVQPKEKKLTPAAKEAPKKSAPAKTAAPQPQGKAVIAQGTKLTLSLTVTDDVWLQVKVDDKIIFQNVLKKGLTESWDASDNFKIWTAKSECLQLELNGNDLGSAGTGAKKYIIITREGIRK
jgi:cytoskeletal protein RodZ